jgi:hypothetical protein
VELRHRRGKCADTGRDADRDVEDIVDHQGAGGEQAGIRSEVFPGDGVGTTIARIGLDGLPIGKVEQRQEYQDGGHDRPDQVQPFGTERNEEGQRSLGAIG